MGIKDVMANIKTFLRDILGFVNADLIDLAAAYAEAVAALRSIGRECTDIREAIRSSKAEDIDLMVIENSFYVIQDAAEAALERIGGNDGK